MFSDALRILDENTVNYMIEEFKAEIAGLKCELKVKGDVIEEKDNEIIRLRRQIENLQK